MRPVNSYTSQITWQLRPVVSKRRLEQQGFQVA